MPMDIRPSGEQVIEDQSTLDLEAAARAVLVDRKQDLQRFDELRQMFQQPCAIAQRLANQADMELLEVPQAAVDHLGGGRGSLGAAATALEQSDLVPLTGELPGDARSVDSPSNNRDSHFRIVPCITCKPEVGRGFENATNCEPTGTG